MKTTLFEVGEKAMFPCCVQHPADRINVSPACILDIDQEVTQVKDHKNVNFFGQDLINVILKAGWCVW